MAPPLCFRNQDKIRKNHPTPCYLTFLFLLPTYSPLSYPLHPSLQTEALFYACVVSDDNSFRVAGHDWKQSF